MLQKKKLGIFINSLVRAGAEKVTAMLINELHADYEIHLLMFNTSEIEFAIPSDIHIIQIGKPQTDSKSFLDVLKMPFLAFKMKKYLLKNNIPVMLSFLNRPNFISGLIKMFGWKGKSIISERTMTSTYYSTKTLGGKLGRYLVSKLYKYADVIITNSELCKKDLIETFSLKNKIETINNPINLEEIENNIKYTVPPFIKLKDTFVFCNIGRCNEHKNQELLLNAFATIAPLQPCHLIIVGKNVPAQLLNKIVDKKIENSVTLVGVQSNIYPYLIHSDCFVLSSRLEGFPNVIIEALACGKPVVSTDCKAGPREILSPNVPYYENWEKPEIGEYGILTQSENTSMLATAMELIMNDKELQKKYNKKGFERVQGYDMKIICKTFIQIIEAQY